MAAMNNTPSERQRLPFTTHYCVFTFNFFHKCKNTRIFPHFMLTFRSQNLTLTSIILPKVINRVRVAKIYVCTYFDILPHQYVCLLDWNGLGRGWGRNRPWYYHPSIRLVKLSKPLENMSGWLSARFKSANLKRPRHYRVKHEGWVDDKLILKSNSMIMIRSVL